MHRISHKIAVEPLRSRYHVFIYVFAGRLLVVTFSITSFPDRKSALACRDRIYEAIGAPF